jgi:hypothetical protein
MFEVNVSFESIISFLSSSDLLFVIFWVLLLAGAFVVAFPEPSTLAHGGSHREDGPRRS